LPGLGIISLTKPLLENSRRGFCLPEFRSLLSACLYPNLTRYNSKPRRVSRMAEKNFIFF